jgi:hypothetical protein
MSQPIINNKFKSTTIFGLLKNEDYSEGPLLAYTYIQRDLAVDGRAKLNNGISLIGHNIMNLAASLCWTNTSVKSNFMSGSILTRMVLTKDNQFTIDTTGTYRVRFAPTFFLI